MTKRRSSKPNKPSTRAEKLRSVLEWKFPHVDDDDLEQIETARSQGQDLETAIESVVKQYADDEGEIDHEDKEEEDAQFAETLKAAFAFKAEERSDTQLNALYREAQAAGERQRKRWKLAQLEEFKEFKRDPKTAADFSYWRLRAYWNLREAATLFFGKDPRKVRLELSPLSRPYREVLEQIRRAAEAEEIGKRGQVRPALLVSWAKRLGIEYAPEIETVVLARKKARDSTQTTGSQVDDVNAKDLYSLYRMVLGMAISKYGFDPEYNPAAGGARRSPAFASIVYDLGKVGTPLTVKPVREHLRDALAYAVSKGLKLKKPPEPKS